jgi:hypothetical protein
MTAEGEDSFGRVDPISERMADLVQATLELRTMVSSSLHWGRPAGLM